MFIDVKMKRRKKLCDFRITVYRRTSFFVPFLLHFRLCSLANDVVLRETHFVITFTSFAYKSITSVVGYPSTHAKRERRRHSKRARKKNEIRYGLIYLNRMSNDSSHPNAHIISWTLYIFSILLSAPAVCVSDSTLEFKPNVFLGETILFLNMLFSITPISICVRDSRWEKSWRTNWRKKIKSQQIFFTWRVRKKSHLNIFMSML